MIPFSEFSPVLIYAITNFKAYKFIPIAYIGYLNISVVHKQNLKLELWSMYMVLLEFPINFLGDLKISQTIVRNLLP